MSRSSLGSTIYQCLPTDTKRKLFICFLQLGKKVTKMCFSKGGILWRFVIKICLIKRSTEVIWTQWQNFLQDPCMRKKMKILNFFFFKQMTRIKLFVQILSTNGFALTRAYSLHLLLLCKVPGEKTTLWKMSKGEYSRMLVCNTGQSNKNNDSWLNHKYFIFTSY